MWFKWFPLLHKIAQCDHGKCRFIQASVTILPFIHQSKKKVFHFKLKPEQILNEVQCVIKSSCMVECDETFKTEFQDTVQYNYI